VTTTRRDADLARRIAERHGRNGSTVSVLAGSGLVNHVFMAGSGSDRMVIRFAIDPRRPDEFEVEQWCQARAGAHGVPVAAPLARGVLDGVPYSLQEFVPGVPGTALPRDGAWERLGRFAASVSEIVPGEDAPDGLFTRFGRDLPAAWRAHIDYNLGALGEGDPLLALGVYGAGDAPSLGAAIGALRDAPLTFGLTHGDLAPRNMLVREDGQVVLIDWGGASAGPAPWTDLETVYRWHLAGDPPEGFEVPVAGDDLAAFARGCGVDLGTVTPLLEALVLLHSLDLARWALDIRPDLLQHHAEGAATSVRRFLTLGPVAGARGAGQTGSPGP
jgi:aminoglycoside phosphotransferase (APT) family kinase protein